ncbi:hypothetical protein ACIBEJ_35285 [Nonomuraea sp. NPDC050790]|uniref:hypothetical protein n=1 Tax=Nonomuraea sp. NPDC050790 TaxID=3364371 RepID=UPI0037B1BA56
MAEQGQKATLRTLGGNTVEFVHEGGIYGFGSWTCNGCHTSARNRLENANAHAAECRAE